MTRGSRADGSHPRPQAKGSSPDKARAATVASLGVRARLVPVEPECAPNLADLLARYDALCQAWQHLARQACTLLGQKVSSGRCAQTPRATKMDP